MTFRHKKKLLANAFEELALECMKIQVQKDRDIYEYAPSIVNFHKNLILGNLQESLNKDFFVYNYDTILREKIDHSSFSVANRKQMNKINSMPLSISERVKNGYLFKPNHLYLENNLVKIDWKKFNLEEHIRFLKESIIHESISICDTNILNGYWDGSNLLMQKSKGMINESGALDCDKKPYTYARKVFNKTGKEIYRALSKEGFLVENIYDAGSLRRKKSVVGDIDFIVNIVGHNKLGQLNNNDYREEKIFTEQYQWLFGNAIKKNIESDICKSYKNITQFISEGMQCDVFFCTPTSIPTRRCYWTGSAAHNVKILYEGFKKDIIFSFDYIYDKNNKKLLKPKNEKEIFNIFGLDYVPPEQRY